MTNYNALTTDEAQPYISFEDFVGDGLPTEYEYASPQVVPREVQPASYVRYSDMPLGAVALNRNILL